MGLKRYVVIIWTIAMLGNFGAARCAWSGELYDRVKTYYQALLKGGITDSSKLGEILPHVVKDFMDVYGPYETGLEGFGPLASQLDPRTVNKEVDGIMLEAISRWRTDREYPKLREEIYKVITERVEDFIKDYEGRRMMDEALSIGKASTKLDLNMNRYVEGDGKRQDLSKIIVWVMMSKPIPQLEGGLYGKDASLGATVLLDLIDGNDDFLMRKMAEPLPLRYKALDLIDVRGPLRFGGNSPLYERSLTAAIPVLLPVIIYEVCFSGLHGIRKNRSSGEVYYDCGFARLDLDLIRRVREKVENQARKHNA